MLLLSTERGGGVERDQPDRVHGIGIVSPAARLGGGRVVSRQRLRTSGAALPAGRRPERPPALLGRGTPGLHGDGLHAVADSRLAVPADLGDGNGRRRAGVQGSAGGERDARGGEPGSGAGAGSFRAHGRGDGQRLRGAGLGGGGRRGSIEPARDAHDVLQRHAGRRGHATGERDLREHRRDGHDGFGAGSADYAAVRGRGGRQRKPGGGLRQCERRADRNLAAGVADHERRSVAGAVACHAQFQQSARIRGAGFHHAGPGTDKLGAEDAVDVGARSIAGQLRTDRISGDGLKLDGGRNKSDVPGGGPGKLARRRRFEPGSLFGRMGRAGDRQLFGRLDSNHGDAGVVRLVHLHGGGEPRAVRGDAHVQQRPGGRRADFHYHRRRDQHGESGVRRRGGFPSPDHGGRARRGAAHRDGKADRERSLLFRLFRDRSPDSEPAHHRQHSGHDAGDRLGHVSLHLPCAGADRVADRHARLQGAGEPLCGRDVVLRTDVSRTAVRFGYRDASGHAGFRPIHDGQHRWNAV